jgi:hypothetical protein
VQSRLAAYIAHFALGLGEDGDADAAGAENFVRVEELRLADVSQNVFVEHGSLFVFTSRP